MKAARLSRSCGFTLIELVITLALLSLISLTALPIAEITKVRSNETVLRQSLRQIRVAVDQYKAEFDAGHIAKSAGDSGYPPNLETLTSPVPLINNPSRSVKVFLRNVPRDPFATDMSIPDAQTWGIRSYESSSVDPQPGADVFDIHSKSLKKGLNGIPYQRW
jgi:general secretion pathway protein G